NLADKQSRYTAKHPDVVAAQAQLNAALGQLASAKANAKTIAPKPTAAPPPTTKEDIAKLKK
ncbi:MAG: protein kinase, partial [Myxococcales bacterium]|nr:protein kinase [Myxococcales bacterium]